MLCAKAWRKVMDRIDTNAQRKAMSLDDDRKSV